MNIIILCNVLHFPGTEIDCRIGDGNGYLSKAEKFLGIPNYKDRDITEGSIYHVIMHGKNLMGSHSSQLTNKERWQIVQYVGKLRNDLLK